MNRENERVVRKVVPRPDSSWRQANYKLARKRQKRALFCPSGPHRL